MAVGVRGGASGNAGLSGNSGSCAFALPAGSAVGDTAVFGVCLNNGTATYTPPSGTNVALTPQDNFSSALLTEIWARDLTSADVTAGSLTVTSSVSGRFSGGMIVLTGTTAASLLVSLVSQNAASTSQATNTVASVPAGSMQVDFLFCRAGSTTATGVGTPAGFSQDVLCQTAESTSPNYTTAVEHKTATVSGTVGGESFSTTLSSTSSTYVIAAPAASNAATATGTVSIDGTATGSAPASASGTVTVGGSATADLPPPPPPPPPPPVAPRGRSIYFDQTIAGPHTLLVSADVLSAGTVVATGLPVVSGSVTGDRSQFARRTCSVVIGDPAYKPQGLPGDLLTPYGNEIRLWRGAITPVGPELICVGTFGIRSVDFDQGGAFTGITVTGVDRSKRVAEDRFPYPRTSMYSGTVLGQIQTLLSESVPFAPVIIDPRLRDATFGQATWASDRDKAILDLAASVGGEVFAGPMGEFIVQPVPSITDPPAFTVSGGPGGVLVSARRSLSRDGAINGVVARGQSVATDDAPPVSDVIVDDDPTSPTYWRGPYGHVVGFYDSSLLADKDQCNTAARALLANHLGLSRSLDFGMAVNPALEPGDVVAVVDPDSGNAELHLIDQLTIPLDAKGVASAQTRSTLATAAPTTDLYAGNLT